MSGETFLNNPLALNANYEALINSLDDLIWSVSSDFKLIAANNAFIKSLKVFTGITIKPGDDIFMRDFFHNDYLFFWEDAYQKALEGASLKKELYTPAIPNRPESWMETSFNPIYKDGKITAIACYSKDITEKKFKEELLIKSEARLAEAQAVAKVGSWETDLLNHNVTCSAETLRIFDLDPNHFKSSQPGFLQFIHPDDQAKVDKAFTDSLESASDNSIEHRIILRDGKIKSVQERWRIIRDDQNNPLRAVGTCQDITKRKSAEEKIRVTSKALQNNLKDINKIMDSSLDVICVVDVNGYFKKVSAACEVVFGYKAEELIGKFIFDFVYPEDRDKTVQSAERVMTGNYVPNFTNRYVRKDGSLVDIEWSASWHAGDQVRYGIARDVTEKKRIEKAFEIERQRFNNLYLQAPSCMGILKGPDHVFEIANPLYLQLIGKKDIIGKTVKEILPELEAQGVFDFLDSVYKTGDTFSANEMLVQFDLNGNGDMVDKYLNFIYQAHRNNEGIIDGILFFAIDVTEQVISRKKIEQSEMRYRTLFEQNLAGFYQSTLSGEILTCNQAFATMLGYDSPKDLININASEFYFSSEERNEFINNLKDQKYLNNYEGIIKRKDGKALYYLENVILNNDSATGVDYLDGILIDITDKKIAEVALAESENYLRTIIAAEPECVKLLDKDGLVQEMNPAGLAMIEADSLEEVKGKSILNIVNKPYRKSFYRLIKDGFKGESGILEFEITGLKGTQRWLETNSVPLRNREGEIISLLSVTRDITERKRSEEDNIFKVELLNRIGQAVIATDMEGTISFWNKAAEEIYGWTTYDAIGKNIIDVTPAIQSIEQANEIMTQLSMGHTWEGEFLVKHKNGSSFPVFVTDSPIYDRNNKLCGVIGISTNITERKKTEEDILKSNERFINVSKATFDAIWDWDINKKELYLGDGFKELFGYEFDNNNTQFLTWASHIHPDDREKVINNRLNKIIDPNEINWKDEYRYIRADGSIAYVSDRGILLRNDSGTYQMIGAMQDVTNLKEKEIAITQLNQNLKKHIKKLAASNEELERFAYVSSHDLQEPLRMVSSFLQLLQKKYDGQLDDTAQKYINFAVDGADRMKILILDLLEFSRIGSLAAEHTVIDVSEVVTKTRMVLKTAIDESQAKINVSFLPKVCGNESQLLQLFQNLISNAIKYREGVIPEIEINYSETPGEWQFSVQDNGIGIDAKYYDKIFIIFQRLHSKKQYSGTGIGLAICKKIAELHGGKIWVESSKGNGSKFYFTISKLQTSDTGGAKILCPALAENETKQLQ